MAITYTPLVPAGTAYDFERGIGDSLTGVAREHLTAQYRNVNVPLLEGSINITLADRSSQFALSLVLNNSENGVDSDTTSDAKYAELLALQGSIGTLVKEGITVTNCKFLRITKTSRRFTLPSYAIAASDNYTITATIEFEKVDA